jgi:hypothetical protein
MAAHLFLIEKMEVGAIRLRQEEKKEKKEKKEEIR